MDSSGLSLLLFYTLRHIKLHLNMATLPHNSNMPFNAFCDINDIKRSIIPRSQFLSSLQHILQFCLRYLEWFRSIEPDLSDLFKSIANPEQLGIVECFCDERYTEAILFINKAQQVLSTLILELTVCPAQSQPDFLSHSSQFWCLQDRILRAWRG